MPSHQQIHCQSQAGFVKTKKQSRRLRCKRRSHIGEEGWGKKMTWKKVFEERKSALAYMHPKKKEKEKDFRTYPG